MEKKLLAVTGGMGSGKSHIIKMFSAMGIPAYLADDRTKQLYYEDVDLLSELKRMLGEEIINSEGLLDRQMMAKIIFSDKMKLSALEDIVFPRVRNDISKWIERVYTPNIPFLILESAIFLEKPIFSDIADKVLTVSSPLGIRFERIRKRDRITIEMIKERLIHQWTDEQREQIADFVIVSDEVRPLLPQVVDVYDRMVKLKKR